MSVVRNVKYEFLNTIRSIAILPLVKSYTVKGYLAIPNELNPCVLRGNTIIFGPTVCIIAVVDVGDGAY